MKAAYDSLKDELVLDACPRKGKPNIDLGSLKLWWDENGNICTVAIGNYTEELKAFRKNLNVIRLGGIWKEAKITDEDIEESRRELLEKLEEKW